MASSPGVPAPGTKYGPCDGVCEHVDCKANREVASAPCVLCGVAIGYDARYYREGTGWAHGPCLETLADTILDG